MKGIKRKYVAWAGVGIGTGMLFLFFRLLLPYHLFHKEQTLLFVYSAETWQDYLTHPAALARLAGDFLTQFFYYEGIGPVILACVLCAWGWVVCRLLSPCIGCWARWVAAGAVVWEAGRLCGVDYPLSGTFALIGWGMVLIVCRLLLRRSWKVGLPAGVVMCCVGYGLFGTGDWSRWYDVPDFRREHGLALDAEMYFGRWEKVERLLSETGSPSPLEAYYYNLLQARRHVMPEKLLSHEQPGAQGLFLPVAPGGSYFSIYAANEVWFALGDMTMAEHAAILGMIFSPRHVGARAIKRLAEINLINGDEAAAMKYLRLLQKTLCYHTWAEERLPGRETERVRQWLQQKREQLPWTDTLRSSANVPLSLRHLLRSHPDNRMALDYLLCFDLLNKNLTAFAGDYRAFGSGRPLVRLYGEALLAYLAGTQASPEEVRQWQIPGELMAEFNEYTRLYEASGGNRTVLKAKYGKTYWFYFHFENGK